MDPVMRLMPLLFGLSMLFAGSGVAAADRIAGQPFATRSVVYAPKAMAATSHPLATQIALDVMREGGSAMDAAIAANAALGLMEPTGNGIGGDLFAIVWDPKTSRLHGYDGSAEPTGQNTAMSDGGVIELESGFSYEAVRGLMQKGHTVRFANGPYGGYQAIARDPDTGVYAGASESRKDGQAAGF